MGVKSLPVRSEILEAGYEPAPKLGEVLEFLSGRRDKKSLEIVASPEKFFERTVVTESMLNIFEAVLDAFEGKRKRIFILRSFYGGGKTHTLLTIFHALKNPDAILKVKDLPAHLRVKLEEIVKRIKNMKIDVVCFAGDNSVYSGVPLSPVNVGSYTYRTVWGYIAHALGKYRMLKEYDEKLTAPQENITRKVLEGERVLFLFDELADYITMLIGGDYIGYAKSVVTFIEYFSKAVASSNCVAIFTLPIEEGKIEWRYKSIEHIESLRVALEKEAENFEPLKSKDVVEILKKRIFENIPGTIRETSVERFKEVRVNYPQYFTTNYELEVDKNYPFSPEYIEVLERLVRETSLQKTRAALEITIEVVKAIHTKDSDPEVIKPWHIDLSKFSVFGDKSEYQQIYARQVIVEPEIHSLILKTIFYYTFYYDSGVERKEFPTKNEIVRSVYEPDKFERLNLNVVDIENELENLKKRDDILNLYFSEERYWFWKLPSIKEYVNKTASRILKSGDPRIWDYVKHALKESYKYTGTKKTKIELKNKFQDFIILDDEKYPEDNEKLKLVVILKSELTFGNFPSKIIEFSESGTRRNRNTMVVLLPHSLPRDKAISWTEKSEYEKMLEKSAKLVAIDEVKEKISEWFEDERIIEIQKKMLEGDKSTAEKDLQGLIVRVYSYVLYPEASGIREVKILEPSMNIAEGVWKTLAKEDKVAEKISVDYLATFIKNNLGIDIDRDEESWLYSQVRSWFRQNVSLPFLTDEAIEKGIIKCVKDLRLGIKREKEVFFKPVHDKIPATKDPEGLAPSSLMDNDVVMTRKKAILEQIESLISKETERETLTHIEKISYYIYPEIGGSERYPISAIRGLTHWEEIFLDGVIVREVTKISKDEPKIDVQVIPSKEIEISEGELAKYIIIAKPYKFDPEKIRIVISSGGKEILNELMHKKNGYFEKSIELELEKDEESFSTLIYPEGFKFVDQKKYTVEIILKAKKRKKGKRKLETDEIGKEHIGYNLLKISNIYDLNALKEIANDPILSKLEGKANGEIYGNEKGGEMILEIKNMQIEVATNAGVELAEYCSERTVKRFEIDFKNISIDERLVNSLRKLNKKVKFTLEVEE